MNEQQLPPLPDNPKHVFLGHHIYTADQMQAYARAALAANVPADPCLVLWKAMNAAGKVGNRTDDKLIVKFLREAGYCIAATPAPAPEADEVTYLRERCMGLLDELGKVEREWAERLRKATAPAQAQQSAEPTDAELLALWAKHEKHWKFEQNVLRFSRALLEAKPEAQQPLTDEQILTTLRPAVWAHVEGQHKVQMLSDARAIEAAHGIGASGEASK